MLTRAIVNDVDNLGAEIGSALILEDRSYPTAVRLGIYIADSAALFLAGVGSLIGYVVLVRKTHTQEFPFLEGSAQAT